MDQPNSSVQCYVKDTGYQGFSQYNGDGNINSHGLFYGSWSITHSVCIWSLYI